MFIVFGSRLIHLLRRLRDGFRAIWCLLLGIATVYCDSTAEYILLVSCALLIIYRVQLA